MKAKKLKTSAVFIITFIIFIILIINLTKILMWYLNHYKVTQTFTQIEKIKKDNKIDELQHLNNDIIGWLTIKNTDINYPLVQGEDNYYYLSHSLDKTSNAAGWVFIDYRNNMDNLNKNTIIYAHNRVDNLMFGTLKNMLKDSWLNNKENHIIETNFLNQTYYWQIFSIYHIKTTNDYLKINFKDNEFIKFIQKIKNRSLYDFKTSIQEEDYIITLSTCYSKTERLVVHAKMLPIY